MLTAAELLAMWERGAAHSQPARALAFLAAAHPEAAAEELLAMPVGRRDAEILSLRRENFGDHFTGVTSCPACSMTVELGFTTADLLAAVAEPRDGPLEVRSGERLHRFRLPDTADVMAAAASDDPQRVLLERCTEEAVPGEDAEAVAGAMHTSDPFAAVELTIGCPGCSAAFARSFDIVSYFWSELSARALRIAEEVHTLARAYGWREQDVLALSPWRRRLYMELAQ